MAKVAIALGSNLGEPILQLREAHAFLSGLSLSPVKTSSIYSSEPIGPSEFDFLNAVILVESQLDPEQLFEKLKTQEAKQGRPSRYPKWTARPIDLDIIGYDDLVLHSDSLIIPHSEYRQRLFVLLPLQEVQPTWQDPNTGEPIQALIESAPDMNITRTDLTW